MSSQSSISIRFQRTFRTEQVLDCLLENGWTYDDYGVITYLPLHDKNFNWTSLELGQFDQFQTVLNRKVAYNEIVGIALIHNSLKSGGLFHFNQQQNEIMILLSINRIKIGVSDLSDFSLYMTELFKSLPSEIAMLNCTDEQ